MPLKFLVFVAVLTLALSAPDSKINVNVDVNVGNNGKGSVHCSELSPPGFWHPVSKDSQSCPTGSIPTWISKPKSICCQEIAKGCLFGEMAYPNGALLVETCLEFQCINGVWNYTGNIETECGKCKVYGEPHIQTFDIHNTGSGSNSEYLYSGSGDFVIVQPGFDNPKFAVRSQHEKCLDDFTCVRSIEYHEPGMQIVITLPPKNFTEYCNGNDPGYPDVDPAVDPLCAIKISVNNEEFTIGESVNSLDGTDDIVLLFKHNHIVDNEELNCISVVGSKGLSVSLCQHYQDYAWAFVWAMPSLKTQLYGLCDKFTGGIVNNYTLQDGSTVIADTDIFAASWKFSESSLQTLLNGGDCDCCYRSKGIFGGGGCVLCNELPPANSACYCYYVGGFTCQGQIAQCQDGNSQYCITPDWSKKTCEQGRGDCKGY